MKWIVDILVLIGIISIVMIIKYFIQLSFDFDASFGCGFIAGAAYYDGYKKWNEAAN
jgi:hypothetical protein